MGDVFMCLLARKTRASPGSSLVAWYDCVSNTIVGVKQDSQGTQANQESRVLMGDQGNQVFREQQVKEESEETQEFSASQVSKVRITKPI